MGEIDGTIISVHAEADLPAEVGDEASGMQRLIRAGLAVPRTWIVLPAATPQQIEVFAEGLRERGLGLLAVRGLDAKEVSVKYSFAGVHESLPGVPPQLLPRAIRAAGLPSTRGSCPVVVQELVRARVAGVAFGRRRAIVIEASRETGESGAMGTVTPEVAEVVPLGDQWDVRYLREARRRGPLLFLELARQIAGTVAELQWDWGYPLSLAWAEAGGVVWWLRVQPQALLDHRVLTTS